MGFSSNRRHPFSIRDGTSLKWITQLIPLRRLWDALTFVFLRRLTEFTISSESWTAVACRIFATTVGAFSKQYPPLSWER